MSETPLFIAPSHPVPPCVPSSAAVMWPGGARGAGGLPSWLAEVDTEALRRVAYNMVVIDKEDILGRLVTGQGSLAATAKVLELYVTETTIRAPYWHRAVPVSDVLEALAAVPRTPVPDGPPRVRWA